MNQEHLQRTFYSKSQSQVKFTDEDGLQKTFTYQNFIDQLAGIILFHCGPQTVDKPEAKGVDMEHAAYTYNATWTDHHPRLREYVCRHILKHNESYAQFMQFVQRCLHKGVQAELEEIRQNFN